MLVAKPVSEDISWFIQLPQRFKASCLRNQKPANLQSFKPPESVSSCIPEYIAIQVLRHYTY